MLHTRNLKRLVWVGFLAWTKAYCIFFSPRSTHLLSKIFYIFLNVLNLNFIKPLCAGDGGMLWGVPDLGGWVWETAGASEGHCEEEERGEPEDGVAFESCTQEAPITSGSHEAFQKAAWAAEGCHRPCAEASGKDLSPSVMATHETLTSMSTHYLLISWSFYSCYPIDPLKIGINIWLYPHLYLEMVL